MTTTANGNGTILSDNNGKKITKILGKDEKKMF